MATTVINAFDEFLADMVNLDKDETKKANSSRDWLVDHIKLFPDKDARFPQIYTVKNIFFGSFSRRTKKRPLDDIDLMICLKANGSTYNELSSKIEMNVPENATHLLDFVNDGTDILNSRKIINSFISKLADVPQYKNADIKRNLEAATLSLSSYDWVFDIVPCFFTAEDSSKKTYYLIPDGMGDWKKTDPRLDRDRLSEINIRHDGNILNVLRTVKYWNKRPTMPSMGSYLLENMILDYYAEKTTTASKYVDVELVDVFLDIKTRVYNSIDDPKGIQGNLNDLTTDEKKKISDRANADYVKAFAARTFENDKKQKESITKWIEVFGDEFPKHE